MPLCLRVIKVSHKVKMQTPLYFQELQVNRTKIFYPDLFRARWRQDLRLWAPDMVQQQWLDFKFIRCSVTSQVPRCNYCNSSTTVDGQREEIPHFPPDVGKLATTRSLQLKLISQVKESERKKGFSFLIPWNAVQEESHSFSLII